MLLAGDVGGTKTLLGFFMSDGDRPSAVEVGEFATLEYDGLEAMVREFLRVRAVEARSIDVACFGVAGAVTNQVARLTNVPWLVDGDRLTATIGFRRSLILNDLEALAYGVTVLEPDELAVLQQGVPLATGNAAVIAAGTGLGEAMLHNVEGRFVPAASEGGHADFAPRTPREMEMALELTRIYGRVSAEHVISGPGIVNIYQFTHRGFGAGPMITPASVASAPLCDAVGAVTEVSELPPLISRAAMEQACAQCVETMAIFVSAYGAEAGNIALRTVGTAGVYVGGGIAPKILPLLREGLFMEAFRAKEPQAAFVATIPVAVILNPDAGLIGAAVHARQLAFSR
ncbi:MAG TPA: glucokinase [Vicinamibacterales bacterium]|nr:glucokinase [Vicinamibacterales bacterium]